MIYMNRDTAGYVRRKPCKIKLNRLSRIYCSPSCIREQVVKSNKLNNVEVYNYGLQRFRTYNNIVVKIYDIGRNMEEGETLLVTMENSEKSSYKVVYTRNSIRYLFSNVIEKLLRTTYWKSW